MRDLDRRSVAAKAPDGSPCCTHIGPDAAGHFVKMVHNSALPNVYAGQRHHVGRLVSNSSTSHREVSHRDHDRHLLAA
ncbi:hypothetical protein [Streptomyces olivoreticuli]|uniref:hypothetical protein n=1 Tax=Streptomyces olivoreticuli TaxID=68246 RepID=UPI000E255A0A|nr:hypothetical protein [Streptomyces olivoreticuli]